MKYCINCGEKLIAGAKFCGSCGNEIVAASRDNETKTIDDVDSAIKNEEPKKVETYPETELRYESPKKAVNKNVLTMRVYLIVIVFIIGIGSYFYINYNLNLDGIWVGNEDAFSYELVIEGDKGKLKIYKDVIDYTQEIGSYAVTIEEINGNDVTFKIGHLKYQGEANRYYMVIDIPKISSPSGWFSGTLRLIKYGK